MVSHGSTKDHKGIEIDKLITHRSWRRYIAHLEGPCGEVKERQEGKGQDTPLDK